MNQTQFLKALRKTPRRWEIQKNRLIRTKISRHCPLSLVAYNVNRKVIACSITIPTDILNIRAELRDKIVAAADRHIKDACFDVMFRKKLLAACGLKEKS